jgi:hypothetical protein
MTRLDHGGRVAHNDLLDENLTDYLLQAEVVGVFMSAASTPGAAKIRRWIRSEALPDGGGGEMFC